MRIHEISVKTIGGVFQARLSYKGADGRVRTVSAPGRTSQEAVEAAIARAEDGEAARNEK